MTDIDLRMKAARLMGWTGVEVWEDQPYGIPPKGWMDDSPSIGVSWDDKAEYILPDYPNDMSSAWTLVNRLENLGYETILVNCTDGNLKAVRVIEGVAASFAPKDMLDNPNYFQQYVANVQDESMARAITLAFIDVMRKRDEYTR